ERGVEASGVCGRARYEMAHEPGVLERLRTERVAYECIRLRADEHAAVRHLRFELGRGARRGTHVQRLAGRREDVYLARADSYARCELGVAERRFRLEPRTHCTQRAVFLKPRKDEHPEC